MNAARLFTRNVFPPFPVIAKPPFESTAAVESSPTVILPDKIAAVTAAPNVAPDVDSVFITVRFV